MTFLPIVERELRVAARRRFTYWFRLAVAGFMLLVFTLMLVIWTVEKWGSGGGFSIGIVEFNVLEWIAFVLVCGAGVFLTSDSLSEEKREGTLGLLFLTDLRGYDIVLGKLMSQSLQAFYGLLATLPVLALPLMLGGVTGAEFGRALLVICNTLFLSLAVGMMVSSFSREVVKAMNGALFISLFFLLGLPWLDYALAHWDPNKFKCILSIASPGFLFTTAKDMRAGDFWFQLGLQHSMGWAFLGVACLCVPRAWHEKENVTSGARASWRQRLRFGGRRARLAFRRKLLPERPVVWLALRDRWLYRLILVVMCLTLVIELVRLYLNPGDYHSGDILALFELVLYFWAALQACRFFVDAVRNGAMELMLVTPLTPWRIVQGQWSVLKRTFLPPVILLALLSIAGEIQNILISIHSLRLAHTPVTFDNYGGQLLDIFIGTADLFFGLAAVAWFGMWMGVTSRKTPVAMLKTIGIALLMPWIALIFAQIFIFGFLQHYRIPFWWHSIFVFLLDLGKNLFFIFWSRRRLFNKFRDVVATGGSASPKLWRRRLPAVATVPSPEALSP